MPGSRPTVKPPPKQRRLFIKIGAYPLQRIDGTGGRPIRRFPVISRLGRLFPGFGANNSRFAEPVSGL
jgi:hypothetical protein